MTTSRELERALAYVVGMLGLPVGTPFKALGPRCQNLVFEMAVNRGT
jgi:hypothetical protein